MFEISVSKLLLIGVIIALLFGTKKLRTLGSDLGETIKGFKKAMQDDEGSGSVNHKNPKSNLTDKTEQQATNKTDHSDS